jgi:hypothetical protein
MNKEKNPKPTSNSEVGVEKLVRRNCTNTANIEWKKEKDCYNDDECGDKCCVMCYRSDCRCDIAIKLVGYNDDVDILGKCDSAISA